MRINGVPHRKGDQWGKKINMPKRRGCLSVLVPTIPARATPARFRVADRPALSSPSGRSARGRAS